MVAVAHFSTVSDNSIRVQLPGGDAFAPALHLAAAKTVVRSGLSKRKAKAFNELVEATVALFNSGGASMITLEMDVQADSISAVLSGAGCKAPAKTRSKALSTLATKKAQSFEQKKSRATLVVSFAV